MSRMPNKHPPASTAFSVVMLGVLNGCRRSEIIANGHKNDNQPGRDCHEPSWYLRKEAAITTGIGMQQSNEYTLTESLVSALTSVVGTVFEHVLALAPTQEAADALVARSGGGAARQ